MTIGHLIVGVGSIIAGVESLKKAIRLQKEERTGVEYGDIHTTERQLTSSLQRPLKARIVRVRNIDDRIAGVIQQINLSIRDPHIRKLAAELVSRRCDSPNIRTGNGGWCYPERSYWKEVTAIFNYVRANVRYVRDIYGIDTFQTAARTLQMRSGDCDDFTITLAALLMSVGFPVRTKTIQTKGSPDYNHIYLEVGLPPTKPRMWKALDASVAQPAGWEAPRRIIKKARLDYPDDQKWARRRR